MASVDDIVRGLTDQDAYVIARRGIAYGMAPFGAKLMRPLERRGIFSRDAAKGFQVRWKLTELGLEVRARLLSSSGEGCRCCSTPIQSGELCAKCAAGNDPFFTSKYSDGARR